MSSSSVNPAALNGTKGRRDRGERSCSARATISLPVPVSPNTWTHISLGPSCATSLFRRSIAAHRPSRPARATLPLSISPSLSGDSPARPTGNGREARRRAPAAARRLSHIRERHTAPFLDTTECVPHDVARAAFSHRGRVPRTRPDRRRGRPARGRPRPSRGDRLRPAAPPGRLRARRPHEDRDGHRRDPVGRAPRPDPRQPGQPRRPQPRPRELAGRDVARPPAGRRPGAPEAPLPAPGARGPRRRPEVRHRRPPQRARARERAGDDGPGRGGGARPRPAARRGGRGAQPRRAHRRRRARRVRDTLGRARAGRGEPRPLRRRATRPRR